MSSQTCRSVIDACGRSGTASTAVGSSGCLTPGHGYDRQARRARRVHGRGKSTLAWRAAERTGAGTSTSTPSSRADRADRRVLRRARRAGVPGGRGGRRHRGAAAQRAVGHRARRRRGHVRARRASCSRERAVTVWLDVDVDDGWQRARAATARSRRTATAFDAPLRGAPRALRARSPTPSRATSDDVVLAAAGVHVERGALAPARRARPGRRRDRARQRPARRGHPRHGRTARPRRAPRADARAAARRGGEDARRARPRSGRSSASTARGTIVALGGGCTTDAAGFAAATYLRGIAWVPVPTSLVAPGRRGDRRQDGDRPPAGQEPRRRVPLARAHDHRPGAARDAARRSSAARAWPRW